MAGALAEGGLEVYRESRTGEYDWRKILIKTLGGGLKGALAASPLKPLATGIGVGATGAIDDYLYCLTCGETHEQALRSAAINGPIEGVTTGGLKFIGNAVASKVKARNKPRPAALASKVSKSGTVASESVWDMPEGGKMINGRWYTKHALERMAPNTSQVREELVSRAKIKACEEGYIEGSPDYIKFIEKYVQPRNIPPMVIEDAVKNGVRSPGKQPGTFECKTGDVKVIINSAGDVVSIMAQ